MMGQTRAMGWGDATHHAMARVEICDTSYMANGAWLITGLGVSVGGDDGGRHAAGLKELAVFLAY